MRKDPELEPLRQSVVVYNLVLATPAAALMPNCNSFAVPLDQSVAWRGGDVLHGQQPVLHISSSRHTSELYDVSPMVISDQRRPLNNVYGSLYSCRCMTELMLIVPNSDNPVLFPPEWQRCRVKTEFGPSIVNGKLQPPVMPPGGVIEKCCLLA